VTVEGDSSDWMGDVLDLRPQLDTEQAKIVVVAPAKRRAIATGN